MKIDYFILWVEDDISWYETTHDLFKGTLDDYGFSMKAERRSNMSEIKSMIEADGLQKYDMLLIDFTLKNSDSGDEIINFIRSNDIYTDILFYSSAVENVTASMKTYGLEGVYMVDRKFIEDKFENIFKTTIKKIQEINSMRGLIVGETSELDVLIEKIVLHISNNILNHDKAAHDEIINSYVEDFLKQTPDIFLRKYETYGFNNYFHKIESCRKWKIFRYLLKKCPFKEAPEVKFFLETNKTYFTEVIDIRNKFAHSKSEEKNGKSVLKAQLGSEDFEYDDTKFIEIRTALKKHRNSFESLMKFIGC